MTGLVAAPRSEDWVRTLSWDLPPETWDEFVAFVGGEGRLLDWWDRPAMLAAPQSIADGYRAWAAEHGWDASLFATMGTAPAARTASWDEELHPRGEGGRFEAKGEEPEPESSKAEALASQWTGSEYEHALDAMNADPGLAQDDIEAGFTPGSALALSEAAGFYQATFDGAQAVYEAAKVLTGMGEMSDVPVPLGPQEYAMARELLNTMAGASPSDGDAYSPYAVMVSFDDPSPIGSMTMGTSDELVRGVNDRDGHLVEDMHAAMESGETVDWPLASFAWGGNYESYWQGLAQEMGEGPRERTVEQNAMRYATMGDGPPVLLRLEGTTENVLLVDGEYEALVGGSFKVTDVDLAHEVQTGKAVNDDYAYEDWQFYETDPDTGEDVLDENGDPIELDEPVYIGPTETVTMVTLEQVAPNGWEVA